MTRGARLARKTGLARVRKSPLSRKTRLKPVNPRHRAELFVKHFHSTGFVSYVHSRGCVIGQDCRGPIQAAHVQSRGAGGTSKDVVPLCSVHHAEQHVFGIQSFQRKYRLDLQALAAETWARFERERGEA